MKRLISLLIIICLLLPFCGCKASPPRDSGKLKIVTTIFPAYDFARSIAGDKADIHMLINPGSETHGYEPTTSDIIKINECDIFIYTGGESDTWIDSILDCAESGDMTVISLIDSAGCEDAEHGDHSHNSHSHSGHDHGTVDEHVWTSPVNAMNIVQVICDEICGKDPENTDYYRGNLDILLGDLNNLHKEFCDVSANAKRKLLVFADRYPLTHFSEEYGLDYIAAFPGCSEDTEPSAATVVSLIDKVNEENIPVVLKIELSSDEIAKTVSGETGADILTFYSCHNVTKDDFESGESYLTLMSKNVETLKIALN